MARKGENRTSEKDLHDEDVIEKSHLDQASTGRPLVVSIQIPPALAGAEETYLRYLQMLPCANGRRIWTERDGREPINVGCLAIQVDRGAP